MDVWTAMALRSYPEVMAVVLDRLNARAERLAVTQAVSQITGRETGGGGALWELSARRGKVARGRGCAAAPVAPVAGVGKGRAGRCDRRAGAPAPHDRLAGRRPASDGLDG